MLSCSLVEREIAEECETADLDMQMSKISTPVPKNMEQEVPDNKI